MTIQTRVLSPSRPQGVPGPEQRGLGTWLIGQPATWTRRHLALLAVAEVVVHLWGRLPGALMYGVVCLLLVNHQIVRDVAWGPDERVDHGNVVMPERAPPSPIFLIIGVAALMRVASLATGDFSTTWFGGFAFAALPGALALVRLGRLSGTRPLIAWGDPSRQQALVVAAAVPLGLVAVLASFPRPELDWWDLNWQLFVMVGLFATSGVLDEILYQTILRPALGEVMGTSGVAASAFLYAVTHTDVELGALAVLVAANLVFGLAVRRTGLLVGACTGHALLNILVVLVLPYWLPH